MKVEACKICDNNHDRCKFACNCSTLVEVGGDEPEQKISDQLKSLEGYINDIPLVIDPCKMCGVYKKNGEHYDHGHQDKNGDWVEGTCKECCWYYDSKFEAGGTQ